MHTPQHMLKTLSVDMRAGRCFYVHISHATCYIYCNSHAKGQRAGHLQREGRYYSMERAIDGTRCAPARLRDVPGRWAARKLVVFKKQRYSGKLQRLASARGCEDVTSVIWSVTVR